MTARTPQQQSSSNNNPIPSSNPNSGIPYGHVPAYLPGSSSLVEELDRRLLVVLRDGRHLVGTLRSFDQFSNMVLEDTSERRMCVYKHVTYYNDEPLGLYVVRGDNMVLLGQVVAAPRQQQTTTLKEVPRPELDSMIAQYGTGGLLSWEFDTDLTA